MKYIFLFILNLNIYMAFSQSHYVIEYDRFSNNINYYNVTVDHGKRSEVKSQKPFLRVGDILETRVININEFVLGAEMNIESHDVIDNRTSGINNIVTTILSGLNLSGYSSAVIKAFDVIKSLNDNQSAVKILGSQRSSNSYNTTVEKEIAEDALSIMEHLSSVEKVKQSSLDLMQLVVAQDLSIEQMRPLALDKINSTVEYYKTSNLDDLSYEIENFKSEVQSAKDELTKEDKTIDSELDEAVNSLITKCSSIDFEELKKGIIALDDLNELKNQIEKIDFIQDQVRVIDEYNGERIIEVEFDISTMSNELTSYSNEKLIQHKIVKMNTESPWNPVWVNGLNYQIPLGGYYQVSQTYSDTSLMFTNGDKYNSTIALATFLMFEIGKYEKFIPSASVGISYSLSDINNVDSEVSDAPFSILLGGGIRTRGFKFFSLNGGIALRKYTVLSEQLEMNKEYDSNDLPSAIYDDKWKPSLYVGLGFHF